jgi:F-type H+-transporting ATPase subunit gamma
LQAEGKTVKFYTIGKRARISSPAPSATTSSTASNPAIWASSALSIRDWAEDLTARFEAGEFDVAHLFFSKFVSVLTQEPTEIQLMPVALSNDNAPAGARPRSNMNPTRKKSSPTCCRATWRCSCCAQRENAASEQGSKMTAMDNATRNAGDMINKLTIQYNRTRQAAITTELVEIISGAEAL